MADITLCNKTMELGINLHGAEMRSLRCLESDTEYLWQADPAYWGRTSPVLFPFVGSLKDKVYRLEGREYPMGQHGFARDKEFRVIRQEEDLVWFQLQEDTDTMNRFPFPFCLEIGYQLQETGVKVMWKVTNPGTEELPFSIGAHPAFRCPLGEEQQTDCAIHFQTAQGEDMQQFTRTVLGQGGTVTKQKEIVTLQEGKLPLTEHSFDIDTYIVENRQIQKVSLVNPSGEDYLSVCFQAPVVGIWSPPGKRAPFICIEPWYGRCDGDSFTGELKDREWGNLLAPGEVFEAEYTIHVY